MAGIPFAKEPLSRNWMKPISVKTDSSAISFMVPQDFQRMALPEEFKDELELSLAPVEFVNELHLRLKKFKEIKEKIKDAKFSKEIEKRLHIVIQGNFKDYLINSNQHKVI